MNVFVQLCLASALSIVTINAEYGEKGAYDPKLEICCNGKIQSLLYGNATQCCGSNVFNAGNDMCCADKMDDENSKTSVELNILPLDLDTRDKGLTANELALYSAVFQCCGNKTINSTDQVCCNGTPVDRLFNNTGCCGARVYDRSRFECCSSHGRRAVVARRYEGQGSSCCGDKSFNPKRQICCEGKVHRNWGQVTECCGSEPYTIGQEVCCGRVVNNDPFGLLGCCGNNTFELQMDICCDGVLSSDPFHQKACCGVHAYSTGSHTCCGAAVVALDGYWNATTKCCGSESYDPSKNLCCKNQLVHLPLEGNSDGYFACCGNQLYDQKEQICCDSGSVRSRTTSETSCCGTGTYEKNREICCDGVVLFEDDAEQPTSTSIDQSIIKKCCKNRVVEVPVGHELCC